MVLIGSRWAYKGFLFLILGMRIVNDGRIKPLRIQSCLWSNTLISHQCFLRTMKWVLSLVTRLVRARSEFWCLSCYQRRLLTHGQEHIITLQHQCAAVYIYSIHNIPYIKKRVCEKIPHSYHWGVGAEWLFLEVNSRPLL